MTVIRRCRWFLPILALLAGLGWLVLGDAARPWRTALAERHPQELLRYAMKRLQGHTRLEAVFLPALYAMQRHLERPVPVSLPTLGKGQQDQPLRPAIRGLDTVWPVASPQDIRQALLQAPPGTRIQIAPGVYPFELKLRLGHNGSLDAPIALSAARPGTVRLLFSQVEGILVDRPHWVFENLDIQGQCERHDDCEHAFHVVGRGAHVTIRNNRLIDFNAHIKVNGVDDQWPDHGLLAFNTLTNSRPRETLRSVVPFDLVGADHWQVRDNLVSRFAKRDGNLVSFGLFMKGGSEGGRIERNLVVCSPEDISRPGVRVGISFGGGGTDPALCRRQRCEAGEHRQGLAINNVVAHCNDSGLDVNRSTGIELAHNTLINTAGIGARGSLAQAQLQGNLYEGWVRARDGARLAAVNDHRLLDPGRELVDADGLDLRWREPPAPVTRPETVSEDFHGQPRATLSRPGAMN